MPRRCVPRHHGRLVHDLRPVVGLGFGVLAEGQLVGFDLQERRSARVSEAPERGASLGLPTGSGGGREPWWWLPGRCDLLSRGDTCTQLPVCHPLPFSRRSDHRSCLVCPSRNSHRCTNVIYETCVCVFNTQSDNITCFTLQSLGLITSIIGPWLPRCLSRGSFYRPLRKCSCSPERGFSHCSRVLADHNACPSTGLCTAFHTRGDAS